jgi:hypothetical protein
MLLIYDQILFQITNSESIIQMIFLIKIIFMIFKINFLFLILDFIIDLNVKNEIKKTNIINLSNVKFV